MIRAFVATLVAGLLTVLSSCSSDRAIDSAQVSLPAGFADSSSTESLVPPDDELAIRTTIDRLNATAAGAVADQRSVLAAVVDPALAEALGQCQTATSTLRFEPVYRDLRAAPGWSAPSGELTGTVYALPSLIRIYTGDRVTGTDLTTLHLGVHQGEAYLTPVCVG